MPACIQVWSECCCRMDKWHWCVMCNGACCIQKEKGLCGMYTHWCVWLRSQICATRTERWKYITGVCKERNNLMCRWSGVNRHVLTHQAWSEAAVCADIFMLKHQPRMLFAQAVNFSTGCINAHTQIAGEVRPRTRLTDTECIILAFHISLSIFPPNSLHTCFYIWR